MVLETALLRERDLDVVKCLGFAAGAAAAAAGTQRYPGVVVSGWTGGSQRASTPSRAVQEPKCDVSDPTNFFRFCMVKFYPFSQFTRFPPCMSKCKHEDAYKLVRQDPTCRRSVTPAGWQSLCFGRVRQHGESSSIDSVISNRTNFGGNDKCVGEALAVCTAGS